MSTTRRRKFTRWVGLIMVLGIGGAASAWLMRGEGKQRDVYRTVTVERGDIERIVSATGTLEPVTTVAVGTQVSGIIDEILVDFNDCVQQGQVVARLDTTLLDVAVRESQANVKRAQAEFDHAQRELKRLNALSGDGIASDEDVDAAQYAFDVASASLESAHISLDRAKQNLEYATIKAPISGVVVERNVDVGQTVAASLQAPQLLLIAADLKKMRIMVSVDESDIGSIREEQAVRFTVQAYSDDTFDGIVKQVRLQSTSEENVVNYTVVVDVDNEDGRLLPGMTATVDFLVDRASDVLKVSNAALRFRPTQAMLDAVRQRMRPPDGANPRGPRPAGRDGASRGDMTLLFTLDADGSVAAVPVRSGITDGQFTQIEGPGVVAEGLKVIAGITKQGAESKSVTNPFQNGQSQGRRPMGPPPVM